MRIIRLFSLLFCLVFICSCDSEFERERNRWRKSFRDNASTYFETDSARKRQEILDRELTLLDEAEVKHLFPKSPHYIDGNRVFSYLRLCAVAYRDRAELRAHMYREKAAFYAARIDLKVLGGIDLGNAGNLGEITSAIESMDQELRRQKASLYEEPKR